MRGTSTFWTWAIVLQALSCPAFAGDRGDPGGDVFGQAERLQVAGACQEALPLFGRIIATVDRTDPAYARALYHLGACEEDLGDPEGAIQHYGQVLALPKKSAQEYATHARFRRALVHLEQGDLGAASRDLEALARAVKDPVRRARVDVQRAWIALSRGRDRRAAMLLAGAWARLESTGEDADWLAEASVIAGDLWVRRGERRSLRGKASPRLVASLARRADELEEAEDHYKNALRRGVPRWSVTALLHLGDAFARFGADLLALRARLGDDASVLGPWLEERAPKLRARSQEAWTHCVGVRRDGGGPKDLLQQCQARIDAAASSPPL